MNWRVRSALILGSGVGLYLVLAGALGDGPQPGVANAFEKRLLALEEVQEQEGVALQVVEGRGTLFRLLTSDPGLGNDLLRGWTSQRLTAELGWPESVQGFVWTYAARFGDGVSLRVVVNGADLVESVEVLAAPGR